MNPITPLSMFELSLQLQARRVTLLSGTRLKSNRAFNFRWDAEEALN